MIYCIFSPECFISILKLPMFNLKLTIYLPTSALPPIANFWTYFEAPGSVILVPNFYFH